MDIAAAIKEGLQLWRTYIETRQQAWERKQDQRQIKAIQIAEKVFVEFDPDVIDGLIKDAVISESEREKFFEMTDVFRKAKKQFFKYNN